MNVFSFCIYGPANPKYYDGLVTNVELITKHFPTWKIFIYAGSDVPIEFTTSLYKYSNVILRFTGKHGEINMIHRFFAIDEPGVEVMMVRNADSRVHWKDRWAIREFMMAPSFYVAHTIRDNKEHTSNMMGGLWGIRKEAGLHIETEYRKYMENPKDHGVGHDQNFLSEIVYPKVLYRLYVHHSNGRVRLGERGEKFPFPWTNDVYCGRVETSDFVDGPDAQNFRKLLINGRRLT
jgi:hypothetical protein